MKMMSSETLTKVRRAIADLNDEELAEFESAIRVPTLHHTEHRWRAIGFLERERILAARDEEIARQVATRRHSPGAA